MALKNQDGRSRRFGLVAVMAMFGLLLGFVPVTHNVAHADSRIEVTKVRMTGYQDPVVGEKAKSLDLSSLDPEYQQEWSAYWERFTGADWEEMDSLESFGPGETYRYRHEVCINHDGEYYKTHKFADTVTVEMNGAAWANMTDFSSAFTKSGNECGWIVSPGFSTAGVASDLKFEHKPEFNVPASTVGVPITPVDISSGASGSHGPFTFGSYSLPSDLEISSTGVISGIPKWSQDPSTARVVVTDASNTSRSFDIEFGEITDPRTAITAVSFTGFSIPVIGAKASLLTLTPGDACYRILDDSREWWYKKSDSSWDKMKPEDKFVAGTDYAYTFEVSIDDVTGCGETHLFDRPGSVKVDGVDWPDMSVIALTWPGGSGWIGMSFTLNADGTITTETGEILGKKPDPAKPGESESGKTPEKKLPRTGV